MSGSRRAPRTRTIRQRATIPAPPKAVYEALMTSKGHRGFTGAAARISSKAGGSFEAWDGYIHGMNVELEPGRKIVQRWRPSEADWPEEYFSTVRILLAPTANGTRLTFTQTGVLSQHAGHLAEGWKEHYWEMLKAYFSEPQAPAPS